MPSSSKRRQSASESTASRSSRRSRRSNDSCGSDSTSPTSVYTSPRPSDVKSSRSSGSSRHKTQPQSYNDRATQELSPGANYCPRSSADTYASTTPSEGDLELSGESDYTLDYDYQGIPQLPAYRREIVDTNVRPSSPQEFAKLFPSLNRFSIRHDEFTSDGNMNLRVDTVVPGRKRHSMQLFHLRMYDLAKREFSLRRYGRDSGREVCNSKRKYAEPAPEGRPTLQRSMTTAITKTLGGKPTFRRTNSGGSLFSNGSSKRPGTSTSYSSSDGDDEFAQAFGRSLDKKARPAATNAIKLEFSNYARVDVERRGGKSSKRYEFEWWGHRYAWKRVYQKHLDVAGFHLLRDGKEKPIAHIVPEHRTPNQMQADEQAGGWVPPCHMWISDKAVMDAMTDVADVIMAAGLIALVDDCIKERWQVPKAPHAFSMPLRPRTWDVNYTGPKTFVQQIFGRRSSSERHPSSPLRHGDAIRAY